MPEITNLGNLARWCGATTETALIDLSGDGERRFSFFDLDRAAAGVTEVLLHSGQPREAAIGILGKNSFEYLATYLGILKAGMVAVPLNIKLPREALSYVTSDSRIVFAFSEEEFNSALAPEITRYPILQYAQPSTGPTNTETIVPHPSGGPDPALILYTSGSTGRPKGVVLSHDSQLSAIRGLLPAGLAAANMSTIVAAPLFHMNALANCHLALASGGTVVLMPTFDVSMYVEALDSHDVTVVSGVPAMISMIARQVRPLDRPGWPGVKLVVIGSAPMSETLMGDIRALFPGALVSNAYGTTEIGPAVFGGHPDGLPRPPMSIGYPNPGYDVRLVDETENEGVLEVRGPGLMTEYNGMQELTAARVKSGFYRTGDIMRRDEDGFFYFIGRSDDMFVCSGENIYPREVEQILESHGEISEAIVVPIDDAVRGQIPVAFVVRHEASRIAEQDVKDFVLKRGAPHLHPRSVLFLDAMPLTASNKVDRKVLIEKAVQARQAEGQEASS